MIKSFGIPAVLLCISAAISACEVSESPATPVQRDTLANGALSLTYASLEAQAAEPLVPNLRIGVLEGDPHAIFGDIRAVEADGDGTIFILDHQSSEIRAFDSGGDYLRTLVRKREGPGEIMWSTAMAFSPEGILWVLDEVQARLIGLTPNGEEVARLPVGPGHLLSATDRGGRIWTSTASLVGPSLSPTDAGPHDETRRRFMSWLDPATEAADSVFFGERTARSYVTQGGYRYFSIPFRAYSMEIVDPDGGFWTMTGDRYRIVRLNEHGDTAMVIEAEVEASPVTRQDREAFVSDFVEREPDERASAEAIIALAPDRKPVLDQIFMDDEARLWVRRFHEEAEPRYDVFARDGEFLGSVRLGFVPSSPMRPRVRDGKLYAVELDSLGVPVVVRADVPSLPGVDVKPS